MPPAILVDHVFVLIRADCVDKVEARLAGAGLTINARGSHPGQGTANMFVCFDNCFVEILWVVSEDEAGSGPSRRIGLIERASGTAGALPFGIALRTEPVGAPLPFPCWRYRPDRASGLNETDAAVDGDDPRRPFIFRAQRTCPPIEWTDGRAGDRQKASGLTVMTELKLDLPPEVEPGPALGALAARNLIDLGVSDQSCLSFVASGADPKAKRRICLPDFSRTATPS